MAKGQQTLYERVGGEKAIHEMIHEFYDRVLSDPELKPFFKNTSMDKLRKMQKEFFSAALDGPITYTGKPLGDVHHGRGITIHHFALFVGHLLETLQARGIEEHDVQAIISRINTYADEIIGTAGPSE
jgi:hemoglobin